MILFLSALKLNTFHLQVTLPLGFLFLAIYR
ncbi:hypothetical protein PITC_010020 [Penicillium italicum]|uniref:Uncharacterized protein n=1 Tax=Penicillium italicum TaxID=40296 RepID=A0A0A2LCC5_PENIT|nr:hypothetical protein PITC_010020 [Penicillium italicum]